MAQYTGFDWQSEEMQWISKPMIHTRAPWLQDYEIDPKHPPIVVERKGYLRELGRVGCKEDYQKAKSFPLLEDDMLKYYYDTYFYKKGKTSPAILCDQLTPSSRAQKLCQHL